MFQEKRDLGRQGRGCPGAVPERCLRWAVGEVSSPEEKHSHCRRRIVLLLKGVNTCMLGGVSSCILRLTLSPFTIPRTGFITMRLLGSDS